MDSRKQNQSEKGNKAPSGGKKKAPVVLITLIISIVLIIAVIVALVLSASARNRRALEEATTFAPTEAPTEAPKPKNINFYMYGIDTEGNTPWDINKSDMNMIVSINQNTRQINIISVLRDTYVDYPEQGPQRINAAYMYGGAPFAMETFNRLFHLDIQDYITFNWAAVAKLIDYVGGVDVEISDAEAEQINRMVSFDFVHDGRNAYCVPVWGGYMHLDGTQAMHFSRIRKIDSDYYRAGRQHRVLHALQEKLRDLPAEEYPGLVSELLGDVVETSLSYDTIMNILGLDILNYEIVDAYIPDRDVETDVYGGEYNTMDWVWVYDYDEAAKRIHSMIDDVK